MNRTISSPAEFVLLLVAGLATLALAEPRGGPSTQPAKAVIAGERDWPLFDAVKSGDRNAARAAIKDGANVNARNTHGETPLFIAAHDGSVPMVELLIHEGAELTPPYIRGGGDRVPLNAAIRAGHSDVARSLIERGADIHYREVGGTPLCTGPPCTATLTL